MSVELSLLEAQRLRGLVDWLVNDGHKTRHAPITPRDAIALLDARIANPVPDRTSGLPAYDAGVSQRRAGFKVSELSDQDKANPVFMAGYEHGGGR